jgi:hypothetical protein
MNPYGAHHNVMLKALQDEDVPIINRLLRYLPLSFRAALPSPSSYPLTHETLTPSVISTLTQLCSIPSVVSEHAISDAILAGRITETMVLLQCGAPIIDKWGQHIALTALKAGRPAMLQTLVRWTLARGGLSSSSLAWRRWLATLLSVALERSTRNRSGGYPLLVTHARVASLDYIVMLARPIGVETFCYDPSIDPPPRRHWSISAAPSISRPSLMTWLVNAAFSTIVTTRSA